jgi:hypothetical protein
LKTAAAAVMLLMMPAGVVAQPKVLSNFELDAITAAGILVDVGSFSAAFGDLTRTRTDARTVAFAGKHLDVGIGTTKGQALACCGENAEVEVGSAVRGIGDIVHGAAHGIEYDGPPLEYGFSMGFVVAVSFEKHLAMVEKLRAAAAEFRPELSMPGRSAITSDDD